MLVSPVWLRESIYRNPELFNASLLQYWIIVLLLLECFSWSCISFWLFQRFCRLQFYVWNFWLILSLQHHKSIWPTLNLVYW
jgi:hypothetical protein